MSLFDWNHYRALIDAIMHVASGLGYEERLDSVMDMLLKRDSGDLELSTRMIDFIAVHRNSAILDDREVVVMARLGRKCDIYQCMQENAIHFISALERGDSKLLRLIMKYGVNVLAFDQECEKGAIMCRLIPFFSYALTVERDINGMEEMDFEELLFASMSKAESYYRNFTRANMEAVKEHTRLMQVLFTVDAILRKRKGNGMLQEYVECVRMYFRNIPWPYISSDEVRLALTEFELNSPLFLESLCRDFEELFPEFPRTLAPRSLKDLCRVEVRKILTYGKQRRKTTLPVAVSALCIPHALKNYLLGEE